MFFGGWLPPVTARSPNAIPPVFWLLAKVFVVVSMFLWIRATFPRYRYDQIMRQNGSSVASGSGSSTISASPTVPAAATIYLAVDYAGGQLAYSAACDRAGITIRSRRPKPPAFAGGHARECRKRRHRHDCAAGLLGFREQHIRGLAKRDSPDLPRLIRFRLADSNVDRDALGLGLPDRGERAAARRHIHGRR